LMNDKEAAAWKQEAEEFLKPAEKDEEADA
jgi:hypothetical protein